MNDMSRIEFNVIINKLKEYAATDRAREKFDVMKPFLSERELRGQMKFTTEARKLLDIYGAPPLGEVSHIRKMPEAAEKGELLTIDELEAVRLFSILCMRLVRYLNRSSEQELDLSEYGKGMMDITLLQQEIERCLVHEKVDDLASSELKEIRRKMEYTENAIRSKLESMLKGKKEYFSESFISNRNGHYTLPVKREHKLKINGSVIDTSASGATCFIEPTAAAKLTGELATLEIAENNEVRRILYMLSSCVGEYKSEIIRNTDYIEELDYIFAKGKLSVEMQGIEPDINANRHVRLVDGRHPLIDKRTCVPLNIEFGASVKGIIITGPNTGGKTVALKTVGLCSLMAQCGLHVPCGEADICMNTGVLCDIGDGQSISENLSTFSAHIKNVIEILSRSDQESLVLLDELGSGTDPAEGMGIAISILEELRKKGCNFIATTHYPEIKEYADQTDGIINARMAFDKESLKPLYCLELGEAGESCAFYIAKRLGMPEHMLLKAHEAAYGKANLVNGEDSVIFEGKTDGRTQSSGIERMKQEEDAQAAKVAGLFEIGDSVMVYPQKKLGIVFKKVDSMGNVGVQVQKNKILVNHKRLKLQASASDLYPEDYDFSIIFDTVENRKARRQMDKKHVEGLEIRIF